MKTITQNPSSTIPEFPVIGTIHSIPAALLFPMSNSPFQIRDDPSMFELIDSVQQFGILVPMEVRPRKAGGYEIIAGARRHRAAQLATLDFIPAIILDLDDDAAIIRMVDSNIQREYTLPSERARAYKMRIRHNISRTIYCIEIHTRIAVSCIG